VPVRLVLVVVESPLEDVPVLLAAEQGALAVLVVQVVEPLVAVAEGEQVEADVVEEEVAVDVEVEVEVDAVVEVVVKGGSSHQGRFCFGA